MAAPPLLYINIGRSVVAIDRTTGDEIWRLELKSSRLLSSGSFVTMLVTTDAIYVGAHGELFCLSPDTGVIRWRNSLEGLGALPIVFGSSESNMAGTAAQLAVNAAVTAATIGA